MPSKTQVLRWLTENKDFADQYAQARARQYALIGEEILDIVDEPGDVADKRLRFDARRWMLSKMLPKVYGDKLDLTVSDKRTAQDLSNDDLLRIAAAGSAGAVEAPAGPNEPRALH